MKGDESVESVLENVVFILNEIRNRKFKNLRRLKLTPEQERALENIDKDIEVCLTKLGLLLHPGEL